MEFNLLGTLEVRAGSGPVPLGGPKQRALFALLLLNANRVVARERLIDDLWGERPPQTAAKAVQVYVSRLRKLLPDGMLLSRGPGYVLEVEPAAVDLLRFERLTAEAHDAEPARAADLLRRALGLWRGEPLAEFADEPFARVEAGRLAELRLAALEHRIDADLDLGRHGDLVAELEALVSAQPHRERLCAQLMLALYRSSRQAEALEAYREMRAALVELGLEPGAALRRLERQILEQDAALDVLGGARRLAARVALPGPLLPEPPFPFVGRERELTELRERLAQAEAGRGSFALLEGEAGAGKTRVVRELAQQAAARGVFVLYGTSDAAVETPYRPLREWLEFLLRSAEHETLRECLAVGPVLGGLVPELARLTGVPPPVAGDVAGDRFLLQSAAVELLRRLATVQPLLVVAEDMHWADAETLLLVGRLARAAPEAPILGLATLREPNEEARAELAEALADLSRLEGVTRVRLGRLSNEELAEFVRASTAVEPRAELLAALAELTGGTPLLMCELWRELQETGALELSDEHAQLGQPAAEVRGPQRVRDLVGHRLARLPAESSALVELAAVAGPQFELRVLAAATGRKQSALVGAVEPAVHAGLLEELPSPAGAGRFTHELVRRAIYDRIAAIRRAELHLRVGEALERIHPDGPSTVLPDLAHHFTLAARVAGSERGIEYNQRAANAAIETGAYGVATSMLSAALGLGIDDPRDRARTQSELSYLLVETGRVAEARAIAADSLRTASGREERRVAAHALVANALQDLFGDPEFDPKKLEPVASRVIATFEELGDLPGLVRARWMLAHVFWRQGRAAAARGELEHVLPQAELGGEAVLRRVVTSIAGVVCNGPTPVGEATRRCEELLHRYGSDRVCEATVTRCLSYLLAMSGRFDEAREYVWRSGLVLDDLPMTTPSLVYRSVAAGALELAGDRRGAEHELGEKWHGLHDASGTRPDARAIEAASERALLLCDEGRWDEAERLLAYGAELREPSFFRIEWVYRLVVRARIAANRGELAEALALGQRAVARADGTDLLNLRARIWLVFGAVLRAGDATAEAEAAVAKAFALFEQKGNTAGAARARTSCDPAR